MYTVISLAGVIPLLSVMLKLFRQHEQKIFIKLYIIQFISSILKNKEMYEEDISKLAVINTIIDYLRKLKSIHVNSLFFNLTDLTFINSVLVVFNYISTAIKEANVENNTFFNYLKKVNKVLEDQFLLKRKS